MALYHYFQAVDVLPAPNVHPTAIKDADEEVRSAVTLRKSRGTYAKFTPKQQRMLKSMIANSHV